MVEAWWMDDSDDDQRLPHRLIPNKPVDLKHLEQLGIMYFKFDADIYENDPKLQALREERGYNNHDICTVSPDKLANYEEKIKSFFEEHIHEDEEIRYCLEGSGYFDVRDDKDRWIRVHVHKGDLLVLPEGIYHRFTLDTSNYIKAMRLFQGVPVWTPYNRPQENHPSREKYVERYQVGTRN